MKTAPTLIFLLVWMCAATHAVAKDRVLGSQLEQQLSSFRVLAGINARGWAWMYVIEPGGRLEAYVNTGSKSIMLKGHAYVEGDAFCTKWDDRPKLTRCREIYRLSDGTFEMWGGGGLYSPYHEIHAN